MQWHGSYYLPHKATQPILGSIGLFTLLAGFSNYLNGSDIGPAMMWAGGGIIGFMLFTWFGAVIRESVGGLYNHQVDVSFRMGMIWFITSEVFFFAAFFGALFYSRVYALAWMGGEGSAIGVETHQYLWDTFQNIWPTNGPAHIGGKEGGEFEPMAAWGIPALNTLCHEVKGGETIEQVAALFGMSGLFFRQLCNMGRQYLGGSQRQGRLRLVLGHV